MRFRLLGCALWAVPLALSAETIDLKVGAWAVDAETQTTGVTLPKNVLDKMSPEQRAKLEQTMRANDGKVVKHTIHTCITKEDLQNSAVFDSDASDASTCTRKILVETARSFQAEEVCPIASGAAKGTVKIDSKSPTEYSGMLERTTADGGRITSKLNGHWVSSTCTASDE
jgi:hypothetical protein